MNDIAISEPRPKKLPAQSSLPVEAEEKDKINANVEIANIP